MKIFTFFILLVFSTPTTNWFHDFEQAKALAAQDHKHILLNFSGMDWCVHCMRLEKEIFNSAVFSDYATKNLVLIRADFPKKKKHTLNPVQAKQNETLAEKYNSAKIFPVTLLLDENGNVLKEWEGYPGMSAEEFVNELNSMVNSKH